MIMGKGRHYAFKGTDPEGPTFASRAKCSNMPVHFKNTTQTANAIRGLTVDRATRYLKNVMGYKECVPYRRYNGAVGKHGQAKQFKTTQGRWPVKSCKLLLDLLKNACSNAVYSGMSVDNLVVRSIQVNKAAPTHRRTHRAHGVINPYMSSNCHVEIVLTSQRQTC